MNVERIIARLGYMHKEDVVTLFEAILNTNLPSTDYALGQAKVLREFKEFIEENKSKE